MFHSSIIRYPLLGKKLTDLITKPIPTQICILCWSSSSSYIPGFGAKVQHRYPDRMHILVCRIYGVVLPPRVTISYINTFHAPKLSFEIRYISGDTRYYHHIMEIRHKLIHYVKVFFFLQEKLNNLQKKLFNEDQMNHLSELLKKRRKKRVSRYLFFIVKKMQDDCFRLF